ncbi:hypothetical protein K2P56_04755 [Patescibacteria group bacterium]|nr:hypothetical protein [Patescibacteria group bacterium]
MILRVLFSVFAVLLVLMLATGAPLHAVIPHAHSHSASGEEVTSLWQAFHASLRNEEKKILLAVTGVFSSAFFAILILQFSSVNIFLSLVRVTRGPQQLLDLLRNGTLPYRRFV